MVVVAHGTASSRPFYAAPRSSAERLLMTVSEMNEARGTMSLEERKMAASSVISPEVSVAFHSTLLYDTYILFVCPSILL